MNPMLPRSCCHNSTTGAMAERASLYEIRRAQILRGAVMRLDIGHAIRAVLAAWMVDRNREQCRGLISHIRETTRC